MPAAKPNPTAQPHLRLPMWKLSTCLLIAPKVILLAGLGIALALGGELWDDRLRAEFWAGLALYAGTISGLAFLWCFRPRPVVSWGSIIIAASVIRMTVALGTASSVYVLIHPERLYFWSVLTIALLAILATETVIIRRALSTTFLTHTAADPKSESKAA